MSTTTLLRPLALALAIGMTLAACAESPRETAEDVANTVRKALQFVDADMLYPCTNCGMAPLSRGVARGKLSALSAGAEIVRKELSN